MTTPSVLPVGFNGNSSDFARVPGVDRSGAARLQQGSVSVPSGTAANAIVGLLPFQKGARFNLHDSSIYLGNFGAGTTTVNIGIVYDDNVNNTNDLDAFVSASAAAQSGGFAVIDENGTQFVATGNGWLVAQVLVAAADATANIDYNVLVAYDG